MSVLAKILLEDAPRVSELRPDAPPALDLLVHRMVSKEPEKRPRDGAELAQIDLSRSSTERPRFDSRAAAGSPRSRRSSDACSRSSWWCSRCRQGATRSAPVGDETRVEVDPVPFGHCFALRRVHTYARRADGDRSRAGARERRGPGGRARALRSLRRRDVPERARRAHDGERAHRRARSPGGEAIDRAVTMVRKRRTASVRACRSTTSRRRSSPRASTSAAKRGGSWSRTSGSRSIRRGRSSAGRRRASRRDTRDRDPRGDRSPECADGDGPKVVLVTAAARRWKNPGSGHELVRRRAC